MQEVYQGHLVGLFCSSCPMLNQHDNSADAQLDDPTRVDQKVCDNCEQPAAEHISLSTGAEKPGGSTTQSFGHDMGTSTVGKKNLEASQSPPPIGEVAQARRKHGRGLTEGDDGKGTR